MVKIRIGYTISIFFLLSIISIFIIFFNFYEYNTAKKTAFYLSGETNSKYTKNAQKNILSHLYEVQKPISSLADDFNNGKIGKQDLLDELKKLISPSDHISRTNVLLKPDKIELNIESGSYEFCKINNSVKTRTYKDNKVNLELNELIRNKGSLWIDPYYDPELKTYVTAYAVSLYKTKSGQSRTFIGTINAEVPLTEIYKIVSPIDFGKYGYCIIISRDGYLLYYPYFEAVNDHISVMKFYNDLPESRKKLFQTEYEKALNYQSGSFTFTTKVTDFVTTVFYETMKDTDWLFYTVYTDPVFSPVIVEHRPNLLWIITGILLLILSVLMIITKVCNYQVKILWISAVTFSLFSFTAIVFIWFIILFSPFQQKPNTHIITDYGALNDFVNGYNEYSEPIYGKPAINIPTGILIQHIEFNGSNKLDIEGIIWQRYKNSIPSSIKREFTIPKSSSFSCNEIFRRKAGNSEIIGWRFSAQINELYDYSTYPFDRPDIEIGISRNDFENNIILTPDISGYRTIMPRTLPGIEDGIIIPGFTIIGTYFELRDKLLSATMGLIPTSKIIAKEDLYFNISARRQFTNILVSRIALFLLIISLLFIVLLKFSMDEKQKKGFGFTGFSVLSVIIALLFPTFLAQFNLRQELNVIGITYIEYFYFIIYFILLLTGIIAYLFTGNITLKYIEYKDCLIPKLLYWQFVSVVLLIITIWVFY